MVRPGELIYFLQWCFISRGFIEYGYDHFMVILSSGRPLYGSGVHFIGVLW